MKIYTDGSCLDNYSNRGYGGYAAIIEEDGKEKGKVCGSYKKTKIKLELHKYDQFLLLDFQDCYQYISENTEKGVELAYYIDKFCEAKNYPLLKNQDMAFDDGKEFQLNGWVDGYNFAKHHKIDTNKLTIEGPWYIIEYKTPMQV